VCCAGLCSADTVVLVSFELRSSAVKETFLAEAAKAFTQVRQAQSNVESLQQAHYAHRAGSSCIPHAQLHVFQMYQLCLWVASTNSVFNCHHTVICAGAACACELAAQVLPGGVHRAVRAQTLSRQAQG
jgi:hypothetical protein